MSANASPSLSVALGRLLASMRRRVDRIERRVAALPHRRPNHNHRGVA
jgi:hypothetical protein